MNIDKLGGRQNQYYKKILFFLSPYTKRMYDIEKSHVIKYSPYQDFDELEVKKILRSQIREFKKQLRQLNSLKFKVEELSKVCDESQDWYYDFIIKDIEQSKQEIENKIKAKVFKLNFDKYQYYAPSMVDIDLIKQIPIKQIIDSYVLKKNHHQNVYYAPWREERTPSLVIYPKTNSWYDFGEHIGGSGIDFVMKIENCKFIEAVKIMRKFL